MTNKSWYPMLLNVYGEVATLTKAINLSLVKIESSLYHCIIVKDVNVKSMLWKIHEFFSPNVVFLVCAFLGIPSRSQIEIEKIFNIANVFTNL
jgi:hypothetical protein